MRLILFVIYSGPLTTPGIAALVHAAEHRIEADARLRGAGTDFRDHGHVHTHAGDITHSHGSGHSAPVRMLVAAAEPDSEPRTVTAPLRIPAHVPTIVVTPPPPAERPCTPASCAAHLAPSDPASPPVPPPRPTPSLA